MAFNPEYIGGGKKHNGLYPEPNSLGKKPTELYPKPNSLGKKPTELYPKPNSLSKKPTELYPEPNSLGKKPNELGFGGGRGGAWRGVRGYMEGGGIAKRQFQIQANVPNKIASGAKWAFRKAIHLLVVFFICWNVTNAQNNNFRQWSVTDGLPQSNIYAIKQDQRGYLWIGTGAGLSSFDGKTFRNYTKKDGLQGTTFRSILEDSKGRLWFGTNQGISIYDGHEFTEITAKDSLLGTTVLCLLEDKQHNIWAGTDDGGLNRITPKPNGKFEITHFTEKDQFSSNAVFDLVEDKAGNIWAATFGGINILHPTNGKYINRIIKGTDKIPSDMLLSIAADKKGSIWVGTYDVGAFSIEQPEISSPNLKVIPLDMINTAVWDILPAENGNIWLGTGQNGITRLISQPKTSSYTLEHYSTQQGLPSNQILSFLEDSEHNIWIGTNGEGLAMLQGDEFAHFGLKSGFANSNIMDVKADSLGRLWVATDGGGLSVMTFNNGATTVKTFTEKDGLSSNFITSIAIGKGSNHNIWVATTNKGILKYDGKYFTRFDTHQGLEEERINCLYVDSKGILWAGTANGISQFDGKKFFSVSTKEMKMNNEGVNTILEDKRGSLWFGTAGGLARYAGGKKIRTFDTVEGLTAIDVNTLATDKIGNIWIGTNSGGLFKFDISKRDTTAISLVADAKQLGSNSVQSLMFLDENTLIVGTLKGFTKLNIGTKGEILSHRNYDKTDGFIGIECNTNAIDKDSQGNIWFGTGKGLTRFAPHLERKEIPAPKLQFTKLQLFYKDVDWKAKTDSVEPWFSLPQVLRLTYKENNLTFQFTGISLKNPDKLFYKFMLEGQDETWSPMQQSNEARFPGLAYGSYTFKVMAMDANGTWSQPESFSFTITPPWYRTNWAYFGFGAFLLISVFSVVKYRERQLREDKRILEQTVEERTAEVVKQKEEISHQKNEIIDSITYAQRIQFAILPSLKSIKEQLPDSFILYKPKDIVAGDFYWTAATAPSSSPKGGEQKQLTHSSGEETAFSSSPLGRSGGATFFIAAADCTGHGVPGAMVSVVCSNALNRAVKEFHLTQTGKILDKVRELVIETFEKSNEDVKDGMDISLMGIQQIGEEVSIHWSGANNSLFYFEGDELTEVKPNKQPIGKTDNPQPFTSELHTFNTQRTYYLFTDGYADQFGRADKKLMKKQFKAILETIQSLSMPEQEQYLSDFFEAWKGDKEQTDDVTVIGIRLGNHIV